MQTNRAQRRRAFQSLVADVGLIEAISRTGRQLRGRTQSLAVRSAEIATSATERGAAPIQPRLTPEQTAARAAERARVASIMESTEALDRAELAQHLALETDTPTDEALHILRTAPPGMTYEELEATALAVQRAAETGRAAGIV